MNNKFLQFCAFLLCFCLGACASPDEPAQPFSAHRMVDLTHVLHEQMPF